MSLSFQPAVQDVARRVAVRERVAVRGKFLYRGTEKVFIRGVTYGTFRPGLDGCAYPDRETVARDFEDIASAGINAVRTYTVPPRWLLDEAEQNGLLVMVGLPWEQHVTFLDQPGAAADIEGRARASVRECEGHPAILCFTIGNEIPASIVRWHGAGKIEAFLRQLYSAVKQEDPSALVTYVNFPTTEYLNLSFVDFVSFNVYLERRDQLEAYLARLQNLAGDRPLIMAEVGLDSRRNGENKQAEILEWQIRSTFAAGCAGMFVFAWTDEWHRGGFDIEDWDFGLTTRDRRPKAALRAVGRAFSEVPFANDIPWPRVSVVICSHNGSRTLRETLEHATKLDYPDYEVIVVDDGSKDATPSIARELDVRLISVPNGGLSTARNIGARAATGEIVAYVDDDAFPDPHWLRYLAHTYITTNCAGVGGPNIPPPGDGLIAECVANAPGGPIHVLVSDREAEHIPGCNCSYRRDRLLAAGGFDPVFRIAGDDVDLCWRILESGGAIQFHPAAVVWHHRRNSARAYWRQQKGYGKAEALLERKWPNKYNPLGHLSWAGRLYGNGVVRMLRWGRNRIYHGTWNAAPFQALYQPEEALMQSLAQMPEWYLLTALLWGLCALGLTWTPLFGFGPVALVVTLIPVAQAIASALKANFPSAPKSRWRRAAMYTMTAVFYMIQPIARLWGRMAHGLTPWRWRGRFMALPIPRTECVWLEQWREPADCLRDLETELASGGGRPRRGSDFDRFDLWAQAGVFGGAKALLAIEEHGGGKQMLRFRMWPVWPKLASVVLIVLVALGSAAALDRAVVAAATLGALAILVAIRMCIDAGAALGLLRACIRCVGGRGE